MKELPLPPLETVCEIYKEDFMQESISKYRNHPSIVKIKESTTTEHFSFSNTTEEEVKRVINNLGSGKAQSSSDIQANY